VVLPASGCEMIAKVRRSRAAWLIQKLRGGRSGAGIEAV
jgi:hypothetical protein